MKKFRFPLHSVATVRSIVELRARERFSIAFQVHVEVDRRLQAILAHLAEMDVSFRSGRKQSFRAADQAAFLAAYRDESIQAANTRVELSTALQARETARQAWRATRQDVRVIEKLEEKARQTHRYEAEREDQAALDDRVSALNKRNLLFAS